MSGNLFTNLLSLHKSPVPEENFFTEMVAGLLDKDRSLLSSWLKEFLNISNKYSQIRVETQVGIGKLDKYTSGSRLDILITLSDKERDDYVLIESKIGSKEGHYQLSKYADHLIEKYPEESKKYLVFISKNYELKDPEKVITTSNQNVFFKQFLWHDFYNFLNRQLTNPPSLLHNEILDFMRRKNMSEISRITPATLSAISLFPDV